MQRLSPRRSTMILCIMFSLSIFVFGQLDAKKTDTFQQIAYIPYYNDGLAWHPTSELLAVGGPSALVFSLKDNSTIFVEDTIASSESVSWSPNGDLLAGSGNGLWIWNPDTGTSVLAEIHESRYRIYTNISWGPEGDAFAVAGSGFAAYDNLIWIWNVASQSIVKSIPGDNTLPPQNSMGEIGFMNVQWSPSGDILVSDSWGNNVVRVWDTEKGIPNSDFQLSELNNGILEFSPDGSKLANGSTESGLVRVWDTSDGKLISDLSSQQSSSDVIAWSPDGRLLAIGSWRDDNITIWDLSREETLYTLQVEQTDVLTIHWHPDGKSIASATNNDVRIWDVETGDFQIVFESASVNAVWSPNGAMLAISDPDGAGVRIFSLEQMS